MYTFCLVLFVLCVFLIAYVYALYPLAIVLIGLCRRDGRAALLDDEALPSVEMLVPAFNEEKVIAQKLDTTLAADYPAAKLTCTVISDCSTDGTDAIVQRYEERGIRFVRNTEQKGKMTTLSEFASASKADIVLITDANAIYAPHALRALMSRFQDPKVGIVNGNRKLHASDSMAGAGESIYWVYESWLKEAESRIFSNAFITGAMTAIRKELFIPIPGYLEFDHILPMHVVNEGYRVVFERDAQFDEDTAPSGEAEWKVRVRNSVRGFTMVLNMHKYINVARHAGFIFHVFSRKVLRWCVAVPASLLLLANLGLLGMPFFQLTMGAQILFYFVALMGYVAERRKIRQSILAIPYYFCLVNIASLVGMVRALRGARMAIWATGRE